MATRELRSQRAARRAARARIGAGEELRQARTAAGLSLEAVGKACGMSASQVSRIERGLLRSVSVEQLALVGAVVGLDLTLRFYPGSGPLRDRAHLDLLDRFRARLHPSLRVRTEVGLPIAGDQRAWDMVVDGSIVPACVEAETRLRDCQALVRRMVLKARDGGVDRVILLVADTQANRRAVADAASMLAETFPVSQRAALRALREGRDPGGWPSSSCDGRRSSSAILQDRFLHPMTLRAKERPTDAAEAPIVPGSCTP